MDIRNCFQKANDCQLLGIITFCVMFARLLTGTTQANYGTRYNQAMCTSKSTIKKSVTFKSIKNIDSDYCKYMSNQFYKYPYDCAAYISCNDSEAELKYCDTGKLFNADLQICDTPEAVNCSESQNSDDECKSLSNGTVLPSSEHCDQFVICINRETVLCKCPEPSVFNPNLLVCDDPNEVSCFGEPTTDMTTAAPKTTSETYNECKNQVMGISFPYVDDCQQYILCLGNDQSVRAKCPWNAWYDPEAGTCGPDVPQNACKGTKSTTTNARTTPSPKDLCVGQELGVSYPIVTNCEKYILCLGNDESATVNCIYNAWYDPITGDCGQDVSPTACQDIVQTSTTKTTTMLSTTVTTESIETTTTTAKPSGREICAGKMHGEYERYPDSCNKYIVCTEPVPVAFYCTNGYYFSEALQQCVDWEQSDCESMSSTVLPPGNDPTPSPGICMNCINCTYPYGENCQWYLRCVNNYVYMISVCNSGEFYDLLSGQCGADISPNACFQLYSTTTTTELDSTTTEFTTKPTATTPQTDPCEGAEEGKLVPYPNDCSKFIQCNTNGPVAYNCVSGQEFSAKLQRCMSPWFANCAFATSNSIQTLIQRN